MPKSAALLFQPPKTMPEVLVDFALVLGAVTAIAEYIDRHGGEA